VTTTEYTLPDGIYHENGWFEVRDVRHEHAWLATDSPVLLSP
jgi:hypothetical protein